MKINEDDMVLGGGGWRQHNNQPLTEGCSGSVGGNNNGCRDDRGKSDGGSEDCEDQLRPAAGRHRAVALSADPP